MVTNPSGSRFRVPPVPHEIRRRKGAGQASARRTAALHITETPEHGDLIIRSTESATTVLHVVRAFPGPDQLACATHAEAEHLARSYAEHARVNVWLAHTATASHSSSAPGRLGGLTLAVSISRRRPVDCSRLSRRTAYRTANVSVS